MNTERHEPYKNKWIILITILLLTFMSTLDGSIVNVALPTMAKELSVLPSFIIIHSQFVYFCAKTESNVSGKY